ncbi:MAG: DUF3370 domain-containing protein [Thainema sp.]
MLSFLPLLGLVASTPALIDLEMQLVAQAQTVVREQEVHALPGELDDVPVFNSNSPELVQQEGILLSTFPGDDMDAPEAHLDYVFEGRFDLFAHHVVRNASPGDMRTLYQGVVIYNPSDEPVTLVITEGASYLSQESPWHELDDTEPNLLGTQFSGPGSRLMNDMLRDRSQRYWLQTIEIPPGENHLLMNVPIPLRQLDVAVNGSLAEGSALLPPADLTKANPNVTRINARSTLLRLRSDGPLHIASLAMFAPLDEDGIERVPSLSEWLTLLKEGDLAGPRDRAPTDPDDEDADPFLYGRVAGVAEGSHWQGTLTTEDDRLAIPDAGDHVSYVLSTVDRNTFGTGQVQSAPMLVRYPDTAHRAHGNYGIEYDLDLPLHNDTDQPQTVTLSVETPLQNEELEDGLAFLEPPNPNVFFRGTVMFLYEDDDGRSQVKYIHLTQRQGQQGDPLIQLNLEPDETRLVKVQFLYPPDSTPPQVLTISTTEPQATTALETP